MFKYHKQQLHLRSITAAAEIRPLRQKFRLVHVTSCVITAEPVKQKLGLKYTYVSANPTDPVFFFFADPAIFMAFQKK